MVIGFKSLMKAIYRPRKMQSLCTQFKGIETPLRPSLSHNDEGALPPPCIVRKDPRVPHTARQEACHPMNNSRAVSRGNSRRATWVVPHAERPRFPGPLLRRTRGPDTSSKATQCVKAQHEGALSPSCISGNTRTHSSTLAWKIPWMEEPGRLQSMVP